MLGIKPGLCNICCSKYNKEQISEYLLKIKNMDVYANSKSEKSIKDENGNQ